MRDVVIVDCIRTGLAKSFRGTFNLTRSDDMLAHLADQLLQRNPKVDPGEVEDLIIGAGGQTGEQGGNMARSVAILSKLGICLCRGC
jgi:acetyl-CoA acyltransferase